MSIAKPAQLTDSAPQAEVLAQAKLLLEELEPVNRAQAQMSSRATAWVVCDPAPLPPQFVTKRLNLVRSTRLAEWPNWARLIERTIIKAD
jgi:hypothetical protein